MNATQTAQWTIQWMVQKELGALRYTVRGTEGKPIADCDTLNEAAHIVKCVNEREELLAALKGLIEEIVLGKLNVRKDFSLLNAHAYATKVLHRAEQEAS